MGYRSGIDGAANINGTEVPTTTWSISPTGELSEFKNSLTGKHVALAPGFDDGGPISVGFDWSDETNAFAAPLSFRPNQQVTNLKLYISKAANIFHSFPSVYVTGIPHSLQVAGKQTLMVNFRVDGQYQLAGGVLA